MHFSFEHSGVAKGDLEAGAKTLSAYLARLGATAKKGEYGEPESSICLPADQALLLGVSAVYREKVRVPLKYVVLVGIGGSNLGVKAVYDALAGYGDAFRGDNRPRMIFLDTNDEEITRISAAHLLKNIGDSKELIIAVVSKSGKTTETIANAEYIIHELKNRFPEIEERVVIITDEESTLRDAARKRNMTVLTIPKQIGGRFSVFAAVGLFPLMAAGFDIEKFRAGASEIRASCLSSETGKNPALEGAVFLAYWYRKGKAIHDSFFFNPELESLGKWYRQLLGESIGKSEKVGITPIISVGSTDLHSLGQLYLGGPKDRTTLFVASKSADNKVRVPSERIFPNLIPSIKGKTFSEIMKAIREGVKIAYQKNELPFSEAVFEKITERELGFFMEWKMIETMYLGQLLGVNVFDQPEVELYKKETERILKNT